MLFARILNINNVKAHKRNMPRISGINIPENKQINIALTYVYGIGRTSAKSILEQAKIELKKPAKDLSENEVGKLRAIIERDYKIEGDLKREF